MRDGQQDHAPPILAKLGDRWRHPDDHEGSFEVEWAAHQCGDPTAIEHERLRCCGCIWFGWIAVRSIRRAKQGAPGHILAPCADCSSKAARLFKQRARKKL